MKWYNLNLKTISVYLSPTLYTNVITQIILNIWKSMKEKHHSEINKFKIEV